MPAPAYRIVTPRLVVRCWNPADAPLLADAVTASLEHLRPWMPWVQVEPEELEAEKGTHAHPSPASWATRTATRSMARSRV